MVRARATNGRRTGKALLRDALDTLAGLTATGAADAAGVGRQLLHRYAAPEADNLPSGDTLRAVASYLDAGGAELRRLAGKLRKQADALAAAQQDAPAPARRPRR